MSSLRVLWIALLLLGAAITSADASTGLRVVGDPKFRATAEQRIATWLASHGHEVTERALGQVGIAQLDECYLGNDLICANRSFADNSEADLFLYVNFEVTSVGPRERTVKATLWLLKHTGSAGHWEQECERCDDNALEAMVDALTEKVGSFKNRSGTLKLASEPSGAAVEIDGVDQGVTPAIADLNPGGHAVVVTRPGYAIERRTIEIKAGELTEAVVTLRKQRDAHWRKPVMLGTAAAGVLAVVGGIIAIAVDEGNPCGVTKKQCLATRPGGIAALAGGGALLGLAGYLWFTTESVESSAVGELPRRSRSYVVGWATAL